PAHPVGTDTPAPSRQSTSQEIIEVPMPHFNSQHKTQWQVPPSEPSTFHESNKIARLAQSRNQPSDDKISPAPEFGEAGLLVSMHGEESGASIGTSADGEEISNTATELSAETAQTQTTNSSIWVIGLI